MIFPSLHYDCMFRGYVYDNVASIKIDSMRSHKASIMLSLSPLSVLFASLDEERERERKIRCKRQRSFLSLSFITSLLFSTRAYYYFSFSLPYKQQHHQQQQLHFRKNHSSSFSVSSTRCYCFLLVCRYIRIYLISNSSLDRSNQT